MLIPVVVPYRGLRGIDGFGAGGYGAPRVHDRNGVDRTEAHLGIDLISEPGDKAVCPFLEATFVRPGFAYPWSRELALVILKEVGGWRRTARILYVQPLTDLVPGARLKAGDQIGIAQDLTGAYATHVQKQADQGDMWAKVKVRQGAKITNHVHLGLLDSLGVAADPTLLLAHQGLTA